MGRKPAESDAAFHSVAERRWCERVVKVRSKIQASCLNGCGLVHNMYTGYLEKLLIHIFLYKKYELFFIKIIKVIYKSYIFIKKRKVFILFRIRIQWILSRIQ